MSLLSATTTSVRSSLRTRWAVVILFVLVTAFWVVAKPASPRLVLWGNGMLCVLGHLVAAVLATWPLARRESGADAVPRGSMLWRWAFILALVSETLAQGVYYYYSLVAEEVPFPSLADVFYCVTYPCLIAGVLLLPLRRARRGRILLDSVVVVVGLGTLCWYFLVGPTILQGNASLIGRILGPAYPVLDLIVLFCLILACGSTPGLRSHRGTLSIIAGVGLYVVIDVVFCYLNLRDAWPEGTLLDQVWPLGCLLIGLGVAEFRARPLADAPADADDCVAPPVGRAVLPYLMIPCIGALAARVEFRGGEGYIGCGVYLGATLLICMVLFRQLLSIRETARLNQHLLRSEARFRAIFERAAVGIALVDSKGRPVAANPELARMLGYSADELAGLPFTSFTHPDDVAADLDLYQQLIDGRIDHYQIEKRYIRKDKQVVWGRLTVSLVRDDLPGSQRFAVGMVEDITARKVAEDQMAFQATHDALTGLPNRSLFLDRVERALARAREDSHFRFAVLFLDLDRFKTVNDSLGHAAGDRLLQAVARRLQAAIDRQPGHHTVARMGGDEFTLLLEGISHSGQVAGVAHDLLQSVGVPYQIAAHEINTTPSIGVVIGLPEYQSAADLLRDADAAMYAAKSAGKNRYSLFDPSMYDAAVGRLRLEADLRRAVERNELLLHYQPIISLESRQTVGFEALVRWNRDGRLVSPADFIPIAEDTGQIVPIGAWVLREACRQLAAWRASHPGLDLSMSINLSRRQLADPGLVPHLLSVLRETGVRPSSVKLEITESVVMEDGAAALETLKHLKLTGVQLALDDFGTGYSSLSLLHEFPIDILKLDRSFMSQISARRDTAAVVGAVIVLAHNLNMTVVAEGLESPDHVAFLQALDCDLAQGFLFSKPLPAAGASSYLATPLLQSA